LFVRALLLRSLCRVCKNMLAAFAFATLSVAIRLLRVERQHAARLPDAPVILYAVRQNDVLHARLYVYAAGMMSPASGALLRRRALLQAARLL